MEKNNQNNPIPLDGGWGWVVVMGSFMCNVIGDGTVFSFGVSLPKLVSHFEEGKGKVAWIGSLLTGFHLASGPIGSVLINKYGCRITCIIGSVIGMASFAFSALCDSLILLMIIYGVFGGIGLGLIYLTATVSVGQYFDKRRALAMGITACGSGIGSIVMAPLTAFLLDRYDWRGTNLILAGIIFNCAVFGCLMRPLELPKTKQEGQINLGFDASEDDVPKAVVETTVNTYCQDKEEKVKVPLVNFKLMKNPIFLLICISYMIGNFGFLVPYVYLIDVAIITGIEYETASFLVSIIGISNTIGRILSGFLSDLLAVNPLVIIYICVGICGVTLGCVPFCFNYIGFAVIAAMFGLLTAPFTAAMCSIVLVDLLGISQLADAFGLLLLMISITAIFGPPFAGLLFDWTRSYKWTFWLAGALLLVSSILLLITNYVWSYLKRKEQPTSKELPS